jgi:hypothetical protein
MIKKSSTNDRNEIYDLLFNKESQIVTYSYQMEGSNDFEPFDLKDLILDRYSGTDGSMKGLIKGTSIDILLCRKNDKDCMVIASINHDLLQATIYRYTGIEDTVCENLFIPEIDLNVKVTDEEEITLYFFVYFFFGDFYHILSLLHDNIRVTENGIDYSGKRFAIMLLKSFRISDCIRKSETFEINRHSDKCIFRFNARTISIPNTTDRIKQIILNKNEY